MIEITERNDRGFHQYGSPVHCTYNSEIAVYESSAASGPHVWLKVTNPAPRVPGQLEAGEGTAHLNEEQARAVIERLQAWVDEIPERWEGHENQDPTLCDECEHPAHNAIHHPALPGTHSYVARWWAEAARKAKE